MSRLSPLAAALLLTACAGAATPTPSPTTDTGSTARRQDTEQTDALGPGSRRATEQELRIIAELVGAAERIRSLRLRTSVPVVVEDPSAIRRYIARQLKEEDLQRARSIYVALGMLSPDLDVRGMLLRVMGEQIMGYYDPRARRLVIRDSVMRAFAGGGPEVELQGARSVIVHELVHALQDQHLGLGEVIDLDRTSDADTALRALVEGDANLAMLAGDGGGAVGALRRLTRDSARMRELSQLVLQPPPPDSELGRAPPIVRVPLLFAYSEGLVFAAQLHGGGGWGAVDAAHARPPVSTQQILHPEHYAEGRLPLQLPPPGLPALEAAGYMSLPEDTLGELELRIFLRASGATEPEAEMVAGHWTGDSVRVHTGPDGQLGALWMIAFDAPAAADQAAALVEQAHRQLPAAARAAAAIRRGGDRLLIARGLPQRFHGALGSLLDPAGGAH